MNTIEIDPEAGEARRVHHVALRSSAAAACPPLTHGPAAAIIGVATQPMEVRMDEKMLAKMARTYRDAAEKTDLPKTEIALVVLDLPGKQPSAGIADIVGALENRIEECASSQGKSRHELDVVRPVLEEAVKELTSLRDD